MAFGSSGCLRCWCNGRHLPDIGPRSLHSACAVQGEAGRRSATVRMWCATRSINGNRPVRSRAPRFPSAPRLSGACAGRTDVATRRAHSEATASPDADATGARDSRLRGRSHWPCNGAIMKRGIIVAAAAISVTGAASANLFTTSAPVPAQPSPREKPAAATEPPVVAAAAPVPAPSRSPPVQRASVDVRQAPVPVQPKPRAPVVSAWDYPNEIYAKAQALVALVPAPSERSGENAARAAIEADGYKGVQELRRGDNGVWHAKAFRGRTEVRLIVDARGAVTTAD